MLLAKTNELISKNLSQIKIQVDFELIGIEIIHAGLVFDGSRDDVVNFLAENNLHVQAKAGHDEFFAKNIKTQVKSEL
jgi:hypothetical protein